MKQNHKKANLWGLNFIIAVFGIAFMLIIFYVWVQNNVSAMAEKEAEKLGATTELRVFFSELIKTHGIEIASKDKREVETIIENYGKGYVSIPKGGYAAVCNFVDQNRECMLEITISETLSFIWKASFFVLPVGGVTLAAYAMMKAIGIDILEQTEQTALLPAQPNKAIKFTLKTTVEIV